MSAASSSGADGQVEQALRDLGQAWADAGAGWRDEARSGFEQEHLDALIARARDAVRSLKNLDALLSEARRQCR